MSRVLFSVWFSIQGIIQNAICSVWFRIQRIIKKCPRYYSAPGSVVRVLFKVRHAASGSGLSVLLKMPLVLFNVWFRIQRIIKNCSGYYSASGSVFSILFKNAQVIIQRLVQDSAYSRSQHRSRSWEAQRMSQPGLSGLNGAQAAGKSRESKIAQK